MAMMKLADKEVGSIVKLNVDGVATEFLVVHQGLPGEMYDESCDGTWLLMKDVYAESKWSSQSNSYKASSINKYLNGTFLNLFDADIKAQIKKIKIPYVNGTANAAIASGANGLEVQIFLLSCREVGYTSLGGNQKVIPKDGICLAYFNGTTEYDTKRIGYLDGTATSWWLRSPYTPYDDMAWMGGSDGRCSTTICINVSGVRPALVLPSTLSVFDGGIVSTDTPPTMPESITVPEGVNGGKPLPITWGPSTDEENNLSGYSLERQVDGGEWEAVYTGPELSFTDAITKGWQTVAYRVRAFDSAGAYSEYAVSETRTVNNNTAPEISCQFPANTPLGVKSEGFEISYSVSDEDGDAVTVTEAVDGAVLRTLTAEPGAEQRLQLTGEAFMRLLNGAHTLTITADDGRASTVHGLTFTKEVTRASVTLAAPMEADGAITVCVLSVSGEIPEDGEFAAEVTNNAKDGAPVWEDCTAAVQAGTNHVFANQTAENGFAFNFRVRVGRGESGQGGCITSVQGGFQ